MLKNALNLENNQIKTHL